MSEPVDSAELSAIFVGALTSVLGAALVGAPDRIGELVGVRDDRGLRVLGAVDLIVAAGLLAGRPRWPWLAARAACNPPTALYLMILGRRFDSTVPQAAAAIVLAATAADLRAVRIMRAAGR